MWEEFFGKLSLTFGRGEIRGVILAHFCNKLSLVSFKICDSLHAIFDKSQRHQETFLRRKLWELNCKPPKKSSLLKSASPRTEKHQVGRLLTLIKWRHQCRFFVWDTQLEIPAKNEDPGRTWKTNFVPCFFSWKIVYNFDRFAMCSPFFLRPFSQKTRLTRSYLYCWKILQKYQSFQCPNLCTFFCSRILSQK